MSLSLSLTRCLPNQGFRKKTGMCSEQPWPSGNALDSDQRGPGFEAQRRPLVTSGRASGPKC